MESLGSAFSGLPYFSPMMMMNLSGTCATTRLYQCRQMGVFENDVTRKFYKDPEDAPDLSRDDFLARKAVIDQIDTESKAGQYDGWTPILYLYEVVKASAKRDRDWGHLVFIDTTTTRYLLVMIFPDSCDCGNFSHHDYDALTKYHADRLMCLAKYVYHKGQSPNWVRATYTTPKLKYKLDPTFFKTQGKSDKPFSSSDAKNGFPRIFHINNSEVVPSLTSSELEKIDNTIARGRSSNSGPSDELKKQVLGSKATRPNVGDAWKNKNVRYCAYCEYIPPEGGTKGLLTCSRCKLVFYCGPECQKKAWPDHKFFCKKKGT